MNELIAPLTRHLLELFAGPLRDVRFPDADVERLTLAVEETQAAHAALARAEEAVDAARKALVEKQQVVAKQTERTVAYARIYAADQPQLLASLEALSTPPRRGRGRPKKESTVPTRRLSAKTAPDAPDARESDARDAAAEAAE